MIPPICSLCYRAMQPDPEAPGVWRCPNDQAHEFHEDSDAELLPTQGARRLADTDFGLPCPRCGCNMNPVPKTNRVWRCSKNPAHEFMAGARSGTGADQPRPKLEPAGRMKLMEKAAPFWLKHLGLTGPVSWAPQSNVTDGKRCLLLGPVAPGGGSKSGRKRKKPKKLRKDLWGE